MEAFVLLDKLYIIVLLILAGVTIVTLTGDNGLLQKAQTAKEENEEAKELELIKLAVSAAQVAGEGKLNTTNLKNEFQKNFDDYEKLEERYNSWFYNDYRIDENGKVEKNEEYINENGTVYHKFEVYEGTNSPGEKYQNCDKMVTLDCPNFNMKFPYRYTVHAFIGCKNLEAILLPKAISCGHDVFCDLPNLKYVELGSISNSWERGGEFISNKDKHIAGFSRSNLGSPVGLTVVAYMDNYSSTARIFSWSSRFKY